MRARTALIPMFLAFGGALVSINFPARIADAAFAGNLGAGLYRLRVGAAQKPATEFYTYENENQSILHQSIRRRPYALGQRH
jgi:hypothetical protein